MKEMQSFQQDCIELLKERTDGKTVNRRSFLAMAAAIGASSALFKLTPAHAADEIVVVNWGGDAIPAFMDAFVTPYNENTDGPEGVVLGDGPSSGKIRAMVDNNNTTWDLCDRNMVAAEELGRQGYLEEIDYAVVDESKVRPGHAKKWGVANYIYSHPLVFHRGLLGDKVPQTWADFFNVKDFPGRRVMRKHFEAMLEPALLADGVAPEALYPLDVDRAFDKINSIKDHLLFWSSGAESQQMLREREVSMGILWHTRATVLKNETGGEIDFTFNQASLWTGTWMIPKNNPAGKIVNNLIASAQDPAQQVELLKALGNGPANPAAAELVPAELTAVDPASPQNFDLQVEADVDWYVANATETLNRYIDMASS